MDLGVVFPQTELGGDVGAVRAYVDAVSGLGFGHLAIYDHVVGADPEVHKGWSFAYDVHTTFHEPLVLFGYIAAISSLELVSNILILPQRQTVLVAKQAAEVDILTRGRFRLGVGIGWNAVEYEALDKSFTNRGARLAEQVELLRLLWRDESVTFEGSYETVTGAGIAPLPIQRPIPIWFGARSEPALKRAGRLADGWFPMLAPGKGLEALKAIVEDAAVEAGRDVAAIGMEGRIDVGADIDSIGEQAKAWEQAGATHLSFNTMGSNRSSVDEHVAALASVADVLL